MRPPSLRALVARRSSSMRAACVSAVLVEQAVAELVEPARPTGGRTRDPERGDHVAVRPRPGTATPVSPTSSSSAVTAHPRPRAPGRRRAASRVGERRRCVRVRAALRQRRARPRRGTPCRAPSSGRARRSRSSCGCRAGRCESTWATCTTRSPRATLRWTVSPVSAPIALHGRAGQPDQLLPRVVPGGVEPEQRAGDVGPGASRSSRPERSRAAAAARWSTSPARLAS